MTDESACVSEGVREEDYSKAKTEMKQTFTGMVIILLFN